MASFDYFYLGKPKSAHWLAEESSACFKIEPSWKPDIDVSHTASSVRPPVSEHHTHQLHLGEPSASTGAGARHWSAAARVLGAPSTLAAADQCPVSHCRLGQCKETACNLSVPGSLSPRDRPNSSCLCHRSCSALHQPRPEQAPTAAAPVPPPERPPGKKKCARAATNVGPPPQSSWAPTLPPSATPAQAATRQRPPSPPPAIEAVVALLPNTDERASMQQHHDGALGVEKLWLDKEHQLPTARQKPTEVRPDHQEEQPTTEPFDSRFRGPRARHPASAPTCALGPGGRR